LAHEALNNVIKHARARHVQVELQVGPATADLRVVDDGERFDARAVPAGRHGLDIMRERAESIGAQLSIESAPGDGTPVMVTWEAPLAWSQRLAQTERGVIYHRWK
jgi:signal transduction histidine kinase